MTGGLASLHLPFFPIGSVPWIIENVGFDIFVGAGAFLILLYGEPRMRILATMYIISADKKGRMRSVPIHPRWFARYAMLKILSLVVVLWAVFLYLLTSAGWRNPFVFVTNWYGISAPGWFFDIAYARATNTPSGAHILSYIGCAVFGLAICYKAMNFPPKRFFDILADPFQGIAAFLFLEGVHELPWTALYYVAYSQYLNLSLLPEVLRDVSFVVMSLFFLIIFWKYPNRIVPLSIFKWPITAYLVYLAGWFILPRLFGFHLLPITTLNNPDFGVGPYQETPWFSLWWVNAIEVGSWLILWVPMIMQVVRYKSKPVPL